MKPIDAATTLATWWVGIYTRGLPHRVAAGRRDEITSDLFEQRADASQRGERVFVTANSIVARTLGGITADLSWRTRQAEAARGRTTSGPAGAVAMTAGEHGWLYHRTHHRRCSACGERYPRRLPNCPHCKTGRDGSGDASGEGWATGTGLGFG